MILIGHGWGTIIGMKAALKRGAGTNFWTMVHVDDLADAYVRIAEGNFSGEIFNISDRSRWTVGDMASSVAKVAGYTGGINFIPAEEAAEEMGPMAEALAVNQPQPH